MEGGRGRLDGLYDGEAGEITSPARDDDDSPPDGGFFVAALAAISEDADIGRSMRRDLDQLGFYSHALEAARGLKQAKGTPEQIRAQLKAAGVRDAEIAATGLDALLTARADGALGAITQKRRADIAEVLRACRA